MSAKPIAVLISDIHFTIQTLELATASLRQAIEKANELKVPLIIAGDTLDTKALIRAECANRLIQVLTESTYNIRHNTMILVGNHDKLHEKSKEHSLNFLKPFCTVIESTFQDPETDLFLIPYQSSQEDFKKTFKNIPKDSTIICHQGFMGAKMGHYVTDTSSISVDEVKNYRVISGHYHARQDIGTVSYIGNPYTLSFGEAFDPPKGFQILLSDGSLESVPTNLRKHVIVEREVKDSYNPILGLYDNDLLWLKITGNQSELQNINKSQLMTLFANLKLDLISSESDSKVTKYDNLSDVDLLDMLIDQMNETDGQKTHLKALWRKVVHEAG